MCLLPWEGTARAVAVLSAPVSCTEACVPKYGTTPIFSLEFESMAGPNMEPKFEEFTKIRGPNIEPNCWEFPKIRRTDVEPK